MHNGLSYTIYIFFQTNTSRLLALILFVSSPAFFWEVTVRSDLMTNFILILIFMVLWYKRYKNKLFIQPFKLGFFTAFFFLTRLTAIIPLSLFLFKPFMKANYKQKLYFILGFTLTCLFLILPIYLLSKNDLEFFKYNPIQLQTSTLPTFLGLIFMFAPFISSLFLKDFYQVLIYASLLLFLPVLTAMLISINKFGFDRAIHLSLFDISYFNMALPFVIFSFAWGYTKSLRKNS